MLSCLPVASMDHNWIHTVIYDELLTSITAIQTGAPIADWPGWLPAAHRLMLQSRTGLRDKVQDLRIALAALQPQELSVCRAVLVAQNDFPNVLRSGLVCVKLDALPESVKVPVAALFEYAFGLLTDLETRDRHYDVVYAALHRGVCPFCGLGTLDAPGAPREDLDHYLQISRYPFCGANLRNLSPMCGRCNKSYKRNLDVIWDDANGLPTKACDPYEGPIVSVSLMQSVPFEGETQGGIVLPRWVLEIGGPADEARTWNRVFRISERYPRDVLNPEFRFWIDSFGRWCANKLGHMPTNAELLLELDRYIEASECEGLSERAFLKVAVFKMLRASINNPHLSNQVCDWLTAQVSQHIKGIAA